MTAGAPDKKIIMIAGPNGAGKTTFARSFLPVEAQLPHYRQAVDDWALYDNAGAEPVMLEWGEN